MQPRPAQARQQQVAGLERRRGLDGGAHAGHAAVRPSPVQPHRELADRLAHPGHQAPRLLVVRQALRSAEPAQDPVEPALRHRAGDGAAVQALEEEREALRPAAAGGGDPADLDHAGDAAHPVQVVRGGRGAAGLPPLRQRQRRPEARDAGSGKGGGGLGAEDGDHRHEQLVVLRLGQEVLHPGRRVLRRRRAVRQRGRTGGGGVAAGPRPGGPGGAGGAKGGKGRGRLGRRRTHRRRGGEADADHRRGQQHAVAQGQQGQQPALRPRGGPVRGGGVPRHPCPLSGAGHRPPARVCHTHTQPNFLEFIRKKTPFPPKGRLRGPGPSGWGGRARRSVENRCSTAPPRGTGGACCQPFHSTRPATSQTRQTQTDAGPTHEGAGVGDPRCVLGGKEFRNRHRYRGNQPTVGWSLACGTRQRVSTAGLPPPSVFQWSVSGG